MQNTNVQNSEGFSISPEEIKLLEFIKFHDTGRVKEAVRFSFEAALFSNNEKSVTFTDNEIFSLQLTYELSKVFPD